MRLLSGRSASLPSVPVFSSKLTSGIQPLKSFGEAAQAPILLRPNFKPSNRSIFQLGLLVLV